jgi:hypothetical protein
MSMATTRRFVRNSGAAALIVALCVPSVAVAKPVILAPVSPWNVDWSKTTCTLLRAFGSKEDPSIVRIERFGPTNWFHLSIMSNEFKSFQQGQAVQLKFGDGEPERVPGVSPGKAGADGKAILFFATQSLADRAVRDADPEADPAVTPATEAATKTITVSYFGRDRIFATGPMDKAFAALSKCTDDLVRTWGLDPEQQARLMVRPKPQGSPATWLRSGDYPRDMLFSGKQALVSFRLAVNAVGTPTACEIQRSYNDQKFNDVTCANLLRRARFSPARDAKGNAVPSYFLNTVRWVIPV